MRTYRTDTLETMPYRPQPFRSPDKKPRESAAKRGYTSRWAKASRRHRREHPLCSKCQHVGNLVDHIYPVQSEDDPGFWEETNWQTLCTRCHAIKTAEDKRRGLTRR